MKLLKKSECHASIQIVLCIFIFKLIIFKSIIQFLCVISIIIVFAPTILRRFRHGAYTRETKWDYWRSQQTIRLQGSPLQEVERKDLFYLSLLRVAYILTKKMLLPMRWVMKNVVSIKKKYISIQKMNIIELPCWSYLWLLWYSL